MLLSNLCYLSYSSTQKKYIQPFIDGLYLAISELMFSGDEQNLILDLKPTYTSPERFKSSITAKEEKKIADDLCKSVCMILFYTPDYFSDSEKLCLREYMGMKQLEKERNFSLIVPVIIRGSHYLPAEFESLPCFDFEKMLLHEDVRKHPKFNTSLQKLAKYIIKRYTEIFDIQVDCSRFKLPKFDSSILEKMKKTDEVNPSYSVFTSKAIEKRIIGAVP